MKIIFSLLLCLSPGLPIACLAQLPGSSAAVRVSEPEPKLTRFNLDFLGGTPGELVAALQKAMGRPVNVIIPSEHADFRLPALKMNDVTVPDLFRAMTAGGRFTQFFSNTQNYGEYGFQTAGRSNDALSDDVVWFFFVNGRIPPGKYTDSRFYLLTPYLDSGLTVDDITTAIRTAWKMRGDTTTPALSFHKETKLLIAVGEIPQLSTVESVLRALDAARRDPAVFAPKNSEPRETER